MRTYLPIAILLASATAAVAGTPRDVHEGRVAKYARASQDLKPKGLCMCTEVGSLKNATGETVRSFSLNGFDLRLTLVCMVPRFDGSGNRTGEDQCLAFDFVGK